MCTYSEIPWVKGTPTSQEVLAGGSPKGGQAESPGVWKGRPWEVFLRNVALVL